MADLKEKTYVEDMDRSVYDIRDEENDAYRMESGLTPEIVEKLSQEKNDPAWMQQFRLESLQIYNEMKIPNWGPSIKGLDMDHIATYVRPNTKMRNDWKDVPEDIKETFERLGIPQAERKSLAGVGAQYDSELVYHNVKDSVAAEGVVYTDMESAMKGECTAYLGSADLARLPADFEARLCSALSAKGSTCTLSKEAARIESGIMLVYGDIEVNCTFEAVIESSAEELKAQIGEMIF